MKRAAAKPFYGGDFLSNGERRWQITRCHRQAIHQHEARATLAAAAAKARAGEAQVVAQHIEERRIGRRADFLTNAVDFQNHGWRPRRARGKTEILNGGSPAAAAHRARHSKQPAPRRWAPPRPRP